MQQRRYRPGDVLDDYCPRERRITDHAVVAMIDDHIKQTRCCVCDAQHDYKNGKVPAQRRRKAKTALFTQVLEGLQGPSARLAQPGAESADPIADAPDADATDVDAALTMPPPVPVTTRDIAIAAPSNGFAAVQAAASDPDDPDAHDADTSPIPPRDEGPVRRPLIRATLPRPEGQPPPARAIPEFTIRQPGGNGRGPRHGRRRGAHQPHQFARTQDPRFGRGGHGRGNGPGQGQRPPGRSRRGGKKR